MTPAAEKMKIRAIAPWFGGKRTLAPDIVTELGPHTQYFEPFCGSMAVLFAKDPSQKETVNDLHGDLINLARVIADLAVAPLLYDRLVRLPFSEDLLQHARTVLESASPPDLRSPATLAMLERAYWYFLASWMGRNGTAGTERLDYQIAVRWTKGGGSPTIRFHNAVESLPAWHRRLLNVVILKRDAFKIIDRFEDVEGTAIYVDPPYMAESRSGLTRKSGATSRYLHDFASSGGSLLGGHDDHARLAEILASYKRARIVVSYYDCPRLAELYRGWTVIDKHRQKNLLMQGRHHARGPRTLDAPEVLLLNGPSYAEGTA